MNDSGNSKEHTNRQKNYFEVDNKFDKIITKKSKGKRGNKEDGDTNNSSKSKQSS